MRAKKSPRLSQVDADLEETAPKRGALIFTPSQFHFTKYKQAAQAHGSKGIAEARANLRALRAIASVVIANNGVGKVSVRAVRKALTTSTRRGRKPKYCVRHLRTMIARLLEEKWVTLHGDTLVIPYWELEPSNPTAQDYKARREVSTANNAQRQKAWRVKRKKGLSQPVCNSADVELPGVSDPVTRPDFNILGKPFVKTEHSPAETQRPIDTPPCEFDEALYAAIAFEQPSPAEPLPGSMQQASNTRARKPATRNVADESADDPRDHPECVSFAIAELRARLSKAPQEMPELEAEVEPDPAPPPMPVPKPTKSQRGHLTTWELNDLMPKSWGMRWQGAECWALSTDLAVQARETTVHMRKTGKVKAGREARYCTGVMRNLARAVIEPKATANGGSHGKFKL